MNNLIINGIDHSKFDLDWAKRGGWCIVRGEVCKLISKATYISSDTDTLFVRAIAERMATPNECAEAGIEYIEPPARWLPIESAPLREFISVVSNDKVLTAWHRIDERDDWETPCGQTITTPTLWMPLPQPPNGER